MENELPLTVGLELLLIGLLVTCGFPNTMDLDCAEGEFSCWGVVDLGLEGLGS